MYDNGNIYNNKTGTTHSLASSTEIFCWKHCSIQYTSDDMTVT